MKSECCTRTQAKTERQTVRYTDGDEAIIIYRSRGCASNDFRLRCDVISPQPEALSNHVTSCHSQCASLSLSVCVSLCVYMSVCMWLINYRSAILADLVILGLSRFIASFTRPVVKLASVVVRYSHHMSEL